MKAVVGEKLGMTQVFDEEARVRPVTVVKAGPCHITQIKRMDTDGYDAIQISYGAIKQKSVNKPAAGHYAKAKVTPARRLVEVRVDNPDDYEVGQELQLDELFAVGMRADVTGISKGKGFAGVMKRHNFKGLGASHGTHKKHRAPGSIGACATPARVFRGKRMAGRMGGDKVTTLNVEIVAVDSEHGLLLVGGSIPGPKGAIVIIREAVKARA